jgi:hypothetical protein
VESTMGAPENYDATLVASLPDQGRLTNGQVD